MLDIGETNFYSSQDGRNAVEVDVRKLDGMNVLSLLGVPLFVNKFDRTDSVHVQVTTEDFN